MKETMKELKSYAREFIQDEEGMEFLQVAIIVVMVVGLIAVLAFLFTKIGNKISDAGNAVDSLDSTPSQQTNPWTSTP